MAYGFFKHIPNINYDFKSEGKYYLAKDLFRKVSVWNHLQEGVTGYSYYRITEGERPEVVASKLYGDATLYWLFFLVNENLQDLSDWPKSQRLFEKFIDRKYSGKCLVAANSTDIVSYDHVNKVSNKFVLGEKVAEGTSETIASNVTDSNTVTLTNTNSFIKVGMVVTGGNNPGDPPEIPATGISGYVTVSAISGTTLTLSSNQTLEASSVTSPLSFSSPITYGFVTNVNPTYNRITIQVPVSVVDTFTIGASAVGVNSGKSFVISNIQNERHAVNHYLSQNYPNDIKLKTTIFNGAPTAVLGADLDITVTINATSVNAGNYVVYPTSDKLPLSERTGVGISFRFIPADPTTGTLDTIEDITITVPSTGYSYSEGLIVTKNMVGGQNDTDEDDMDSTTLAKFTINQVGNALVTNLDYERDLNEEKHIIRYIEPSYISRILSEFRELVRN